MAAHLFNESGQMQEVDIPDIFDVLEGGEDENAVKFLLGFAADDHPQQDQVDFLFEIFFEDTNRRFRGQFNRLKIKLMYCYGLN